MKARSIFLFVFLWGFISCRDDEEQGIVVPDDLLLSEVFFLYVDLNDRSNDTFKVNMYLDGLQSNNSIFHFPATVPGTYNISDVGRFVKEFTVQDRAGNTITTEQLSTNQWQIFNPEEAFLISYEVSETFDTPVSTNQVYAMGGTSIENDHVLLNPFMVFGYPEGLKERDYYLKVDYPSSWIVGTALPEESGLYYASDYDFLADSPMLFGELSRASTNVGTTEVDVFVYSMAGNMNATEILNDIDQVLIDAEAFLIELPTSHYDFLFHFGDTHAGALEHSYSSLYVLQDAPLSAGYSVGIKNIAAHEFFHVVTPLNIHSEIIEDFNFATPTPSQHLWLYEGVTEWASDMMQFRNGTTTLQYILGEYSKKLRSNDYYNAAYSLTDISLGSYTEIGKSEFNNVYSKGAVVAALLDIRLLELSEGQRGLREVILELIESYGPENSFSEEQFFTVLVEMTYPEIEFFINDYIKGTQPLPVDEYFEKIGISHVADGHSLEKMELLSPSQESLFDAWNSNL